MEKKESSGKFGHLMKEISTLKNELNKINDLKEVWFKKKEDLKKYVWDLINQVRGVKSEKDSSNIKIQEFKKQRDEYNVKVKTLIAEIKKLNDEKRAAIKKYNLKIDPEKIKEKIERLEFSIETEAFSFNKEKKVMEQIKKLKKIYEESGGIKEVSERMSKISAEIEEAKKKSQEFHDKVQNLAGEGRDGYMKFMNISQQINQFKGLQEKAFKRFLDFKNEFVKVNDSLRVKLSEINKLRGIFDMHRKEKERKKVDIEEKIMEEKVRLVEEKLKNRKKLTNEDLLVFQKKKEEK